MSCIIPIKQMKHYFYIIILCFCLCNNIYSKENIDRVTINLIETSDVHGNIFPFNFISLSKSSGSLARTYSFIKNQREKYSDNCILMDNGDILQGQPTVYYYNFMDTTSNHIVSQVMNYMKYDLGVMGNHDIEPGHAVYDKWISECKFPILGANIIDKKSNTPYLKPYHIFHKSGVKIAVLGMISPAVPCWLPENIWQGLYFQDMQECATKWIKIIKDIEKPDLIVGMFHSGNSGSILNNIVENASLQVAKNVPGFDVVLYGHDHREVCTEIENVDGEKVLMANPGSRANYVANITIDFLLRDKKVVEKTVKGELVNMNEYEPDKNFMSEFSKQYNLVYDFVSKKIGNISSTISAKETFLGPSGFINILHDLQMKVSGADISFAAPLSFDSKIEKGDIFVSDMFKLYSYENLLYVMTLSGKEIQDYLEYSYSKWINTVSDESEQLLLIKEEGGKKSLKYPSFNFDSAAGIDYVVDITKPIGSRVVIHSMSNGKAFHLDSIYKVAINSYRGNGGGEILTNGSGIVKDDLPKRVIWSTDRDMRFYLMEYIKNKKNINVPQMNNWKFIPEELYNKVTINDRKFLLN